MSRRSRIVVVLFALALLAPAPAFAAPEGQMTWALHFSLAPTLFEPAETPGVVSPYTIIYALHEGHGEADARQGPRAKPGGVVDSFTPGVELVLEATDAYWRKTPHVKRLVFKSVPDVATRLVMGGAVRGREAQGEVTAAIGGNPWSH